MEKSKVENSTEELDVLNINSLNETVKLLNNALNSSCKSGVFALDDAYLLKIGISNIEKAVKTLEKYQNFVSNLENKDNLKDNQKDKKSVDLNKINKTN